MGKTGAIHAAAALPLSVLLALAISACGGGGDDGPAPASVQVSGGTRTATSTPARDVTVRITVSKDCFPTSSTTAVIFHWFGAGTSDAAGNYVASTLLTGLEQCTLNFPFRFHATSFSCPKDKAVPCYTGNPPEVTWAQSDLVPKTGVDFVVAKRARIFGQILFPNGTQPGGPTALLAAVTPAGGSGVGTVDEQGRFAFGPMDPGTYTVFFRPEQCAGIGVTGCNGQYDFTPTENVVTIVSDEDVEVEFTATPKP
jgi:hypothetical protein